MSPGFALVATVFMSSVIVTFISQICFFVGHAGPLLTVVKIKMKVPRRRTTEDTTEDITEEL
jgi:hypothetical protein